MTTPAAEDRLKNQIARLPREPGVYIFRDTKGKVLYVGKAKDLRNRVRTYFREGADGRHHIRFLVSRIDTLDFIVTVTEQEALILENNLIKKYRPRYNIFLRDDKTYVHVRLNMDHPWPRLTIIRNPKKDKARYFGPYASAGSVRSTLRMLGRIFPMRTCSDTELATRTTPCLYYHIKRCPAPCVGLADGQIYQDTVNKVTMFLKGRGEELTRALRNKMAFQAAERQYEAAARTRDQLFAVEQTLEKQRITTPKLAQRDVFALERDRDRIVIQSLFVRDGQMTDGEVYYFENASLSDEELLASFLSQYYQRGAVIPSEVVVPLEIPEKEALEAMLAARREGMVRIHRPLRGARRRLIALAAKNARLVLEEKGATGSHRQLLENVQDLFDLRALPRRIECFDISNIQGRSAVASSVTFVEGEAARSLYRRYRVRTVEGADDYAMMGEVLERRLARGATEGDLPDLVMVDGGKGQLNVAAQVADRIGLDDLDIIAISKVRDEEKGRRVRTMERIHMPGRPEALLLEGPSEVLHFLQRIRDEAHRFAITYHKKLRSKQFGASALDGIPAVGPVIRGRLLAAFGSVDAIRRAGMAELCQVQGVSARLASRITEALGERG